jgi:hypothetical protein
VVIVHYTGSSATYVGKSAAQLLALVRALYEGVFTGRTVTEPKGDEYSFVIDPLGTIYEWADSKRGAHCSGMNTTSIGVLLLLGTGAGEIPTDHQVAALLELRLALVADGTLTVDHQVDQHGQYVVTTCPGTAVKERWGLFDRSLPEPEPPPEPLPPSEDDMPGELVGVNDHPNYPTTTRVIYVTDGVGITYRWVRSEADLAGVKADRAAKGWPTTVTQRSFHELGRYGVLVGPAP